MFDSNRPTDTKPATDQFGAGFCISVTGGSDTVTPDRFGGES